MENKLKTSDRLLLFLPLFIMLVFNLMILGVDLTFRHFCGMCDEEAFQALSQKASITAGVIREKLLANDLPGAEEFCRKFDNRIFRLTLISPVGKVLADSEAHGTLDNHADRAEVKSVLETGRESFSRRFSGTLNRRMIYYALPFQVANDTYVLRMSQPVSDYALLVDTVSACLFGLSILSFFLLGMLQIYLVRRVYRPLSDLQNGAEKILHGGLGTFIPVPESGIVSQLAASISRMTEQLKFRLADATRERNEKDALFRTMGEGILLFDSSGSLLRSNAAAADLFGISGTAPFALSRCGIPELMELADSTLDSGTPFEHEFTLSRAGLPPLSLFIKGFSFDNGSRKCLLLTVTDLTNLHRLESFRSDFIANVSHEIKTPLTCIVGAVEALEDSPEPSAPERQKLLSILQSQSKRLNNLVQDILSLSALERQQLNPDRTFESVSLDSVLANAVNLCAPHAAKAGIALRIGENSPVTANADSQLIEQAAVNLIENAIKYSSGTKIEVSLTKENGNAVICVRDDGIGIAPEHAKRIFERFYRVDKSRSRELGGTGLGLAIVKHIAQLHRGSAELESTPGKGCAFRIRLPL